MTRREMLEQIFADHRTLTGGDLPHMAEVQVRSIHTMGELHQLMLDQQTELKLAQEASEVEDDPVYQQACKAFNVT